MFENYLKVQSNFDLYSRENSLLIQAQKPFATKLADSNAWKEQGIMVKKFEYKNPVMILEPGNQYERPDGSIGQSYNVKKLYDISQTMARIRSRRRAESMIVSLLRRLLPAHRFR